MLGDALLGHALLGVENCRLPLKHAKGMSLRDGANFAPLRFVFVYAIFFLCKYLIMRCLLGSQGCGPQCCELCSKKPQLADFQYKLRVVFRRETARGFYPCGKVDSPRKRVAEGLCGWRHGNSFPMTQSAQSHRQMRSIPLCSKAVFYVFVFYSIDDSATKHNLSPHIFY